MKSFFLFIVSLAIGTSSYAQDITGQWNGLLKVPGMQLRLIFHISEEENGYSATMDSPDQGAEGIPVTSTTFEDNKLTIVVKNIGLTYTGEIQSEKEIVGSFKQGNIELPLNLSRDEIQIETAKRPQEPKEPYPYHSEDVTFQNKKAKIELAGTLTLPKESGNYPAVVLISGSGPQNRNEEFMGHKPFLVLSDFLTRNGIAVLRFDDRGTGESTGEFSTATSHDFSTDVEAAVKFLKKQKGINKKQIGLIGHSEGGIIAPMVASRNTKISFIVLLAGTGIPGDELLLLQQKVIAEASGVNETEIEESMELNKQLFDMITSSSNQDTLKKQLTDFLTVWLAENPTDQKPIGMSDAEFIKAEVEQLTAPWMLYFIKHDPREVLKNVKCSVLALNGEKDLQVPPKENLPEIYESARLKGSQNITTKTLPNLNHLFQECETGLPSEYAQIEQTFSPVAMQEIVNWINQIVTNK